MVSGLQIPLSAGQIIMIRIVPGSGHTEVVKELFVLECVLAPHLRLSGPQWPSVAPMDLVWALVPLTSMGLPIWTFLCLAMFLSSYVLPLSFPLSRFLCCSSVH